MIYNTCYCFGVPAATNSSSQFLAGDDHGVRTMCVCVYAQLTDRIHIDICDFERHLF